MNVDFNIEVNGQWTSLDNYGDCPAITFQMNDLGEFKDRNSEYSQTVKLPKSPGNMRALGFGLGLDSNSVSPYKTYKCIVFANGSRVAPLGSVFQITALTQDDIEGQILGPTFDLIDTLNNKSCSSSEDEGFWWPWWKSDPSGTFYLDNGLECFAFIATWAKNMLAPPEDAGVFSGSDRKKILATRLFPVLPLLNLVLKIFELEGWQPKLLGDYLNDMYDNVGSPCCVICAPIQAGEELPYYNHLVFSVTYRPSETSTWPVPPIEVEGYPTPLIQLNKNIIIYNSIYSGNYNIKVTCLIDESWFESQESEVFRITVLFNFFDEFGSNTGSQTLYKDVQMKDAGSILEVGVFTINMPTNSLYEASASVTILYSSRIYDNPGSAYVYIDTSADSVEEDEGNNEPIEGVSYDLLNSMNFSSRGEIVTEFLRLMGVFIQVDVPNEEIYLFGLDYLLGRCNESECVDWSGKLVLTGEDWAVTYAPDGYGRKNTVKLKEDSDNNLTSKWEFSLENCALDAEKDLWESKALALGAYDNNGNTEGLYINYPLVEIDRDTGDEVWKGTNDILFTGPNSGDYESVDVLLDGGSSIVICLLSRGQALRLASFMPNAYSALLSVLYQYKKLEAYFMLTPVDIEALDLMKPVWLGEFGHYFYILKVSNYQPNKLTKVELCLLK